MKLDTKKILMVAVVAISLMVVGCAEDDQKDIDTRQPETTQVQPNPFFNNGNGQFGNYGYGQQPNFYDYQPVNCNTGNQFSVNLQTQYSNLGLYLSGNPNSSELLRYGNQCYPARDVYNMYSRYYQGQGQIPWNRFHQSPYREFQFNNGNTSGGSINYSQTINTNYQHEWRGTDQGWNGFPDYDNNGWNVEFFINW